MESSKPDSLENFVERHRADFDVHEPRPDLWAALETQLDASVNGRPPLNQLVVADTAAPVMMIAGTSGQESISDSQKPKTGFPSWLQRYGIAAGLAGLVLAAGASEAWKSRPVAPQVAMESLSAPATAGDDAALYLGSPSAMVAGERSGLAGDSQLTAAVRGMETYYVAQLSQREAELRELGDTSAVPGRLTDWQQQLVSLDSSYRLLKRELSHHPRPEALLTAMNRNLQIRLDILDQQLHLTSPAPDATSVANAFILADSRQPQ